MHMSSKLTDTDILKQQWCFRSITKAILILFYIKKLQGFETLSLLTLKCNFSMLSHFPHYLSSRLMTPAIDASLISGLNPPNLKLQSVHFWKSPELDPEQLNNLKLISNRPPLAKWLRYSDKRSHLLLHWPGWRVSILPEHRSVWANHGLLNTEYMFCPVVHFNTLTYCHAGKKKKIKKCYRNSLV